MKTWPEEQRDEPLDAYEMGTALPDFTVTLNDCEPPWSVEITTDEA